MQLLTVLIHVPDQLGRTGERRGKQCRQQRREPVLTLRGPQIAGLATCTRPRLHKVQATLKKVIYPASPPPVLSSQSRKDKQVHTAMQGASHPAGTPSVQLCCTLSPRGGAAGLAEILPSQGLPITLITPVGISCLRWGSDHCSTVGSSQAAEAIFYSQVTDSLRQTGALLGLCMYIRWHEVVASTCCTGNKVATVPKPACS